MGYSLGNTSCYSVWADKFGILERISRALKTGIFVFWGRWGLPVPRRVKVTFAFSRPVGGKQVMDATQGEIDGLHSVVLTQIRTLFDLHKKAYGWQDRSLSFV